MKTDKNLQDKITNTFKVLDEIEATKVSPFFKDKTLQRMYANKEEPQPVWIRLTPQLQLVALVCMLILNLVAFLKFKESAYLENVNQFAESYELSTNAVTLMFN